ncbi:nucleoside triphosphate pyrophosphohydrolase [soil metagenome]
MNLKNTSLSIPLYESLIIVIFTNMTDKNTLQKFDEFVDLVKTLRKECPWDREQTHKSLRICLIEEAYEVLESIDNGDQNELKKELGDLMLQVIFHSILGEETGDFTLADILELETEKLISRHPHVFGDVKLSTSESVKANWEKLKMKEGRTSALQGVPAELPALLRAYRIQDKASKTGFDWKESEPVFEKIKEELSELKENIDNNTPIEMIEDEFGDVLFSIVNYARFLKINPEDALRKTISKFTKRFTEMEVIAKTVLKKDLNEMSLEQMDEIWNSIKIKHIKQN